MNELVVGGLRVSVVSLTPDVVRGRMVGLVAPGVEPSLRSLRWFSMDSSEPGPRDVALVDLATNKVCGRFESADRVRGCVALGDDRVLYAEGSALVSRALDGRDARVHVRSAFGVEEALSGSMIRDGDRVAAVSRRREFSLTIQEADDYDYDYDRWLYNTRVFDLRDGAVWRDAEWGGYRELLALVEGVLIAREQYDDDDFNNSIRAIDATNGAERWQARCWQWFSDSEDPPSGARFFVAGPLLCVACDRGTATVDLPTGRLRWNTSTRCLATDGVDVGLFARGTQELEARRLSDGTKLARWRTDTPIECATSLGPRRFACCGRRSLHVFTVDEARVGVELSLDSIEDHHRWTTLDGGSDWLCIGTSFPMSVAGAAQADSLGASQDTASEASSSDGASTVSAELSLRDEPPRARVHRLANAEAPPCELIELPTEIDARMSRDEPVAPPIDEARIEAILAIHREEHEDERATWERLVARSLVDPTFDTERCLVTINKAPLRMGEHRAVGARAEAWLAFVHDQRTLATVATVADELCDRLALWCGGLVPRWRFGNIDAWYGPRWTLVQRWNETITQRVCFARREGRAAAIDLEDAPIERTALELDALWRYAVEHDLSLPDTAPTGLAERPFADVRSPFEPLLALCAMGFEPRELSDDFVSFGLWGIDAQTGRRIVPPDWDIPF
ncbi:MAG: hypothetical protein JNK05_28660 [Myxococcales bacterium]|nr:hypothetical protein [Myxococcales bacterium]